MKSQRFYAKEKVSQLINLCGLFFCLFIISSCSTKAKATSLFTQIDIIDSLIEQGQTTDAVKDLKKAQKSAYDVWSYLAIYKRYVLLGENNLAEKLLKNALKRNPKNLELTAVYASFLNKLERFGDAEKIGKPLQKTKYASIYAESVFKNHRDEISKEKSNVLYEDEQYYDLFFDSYQTSRNPVWIRNCAAFYLCKGMYESAANLTPTAFNDADDAYFWALVNYDGGDYYTSINASLRGIEFLESLRKKSTAIATEIKLTALETDSYTAILDLDSAKRIRERIVAEYVDAGSLINNLSSDDKMILPLLIVNAAIAENEANNYNAAADLLLYTVLNFPDYVPGLISYADFAYTSNLPVREDDEIEALIKAGYLRDTDRYDDRPKIPLSDAISRIDHALATLDNSQLPYLYITKLDLRYKTDKTLSEKNKTADLWRLLEQSSSDEIKYHDVLVLYAVNYLIDTGQLADAEEIFRKYMTSKFSFNSEDDFFEQVLNVIRISKVEDVEVAAYFAVLHNKTDEAIRMYEYCVFESAGLKTNDISKKVSTASAANLANIYYSLGKKDKALDLYGRIAAREINDKTRSEMFYRIAAIYYDYGDNQNALRAADYAYSINPANAKAHLLKTKLK